MNKTSIYNWNFQNSLNNKINLNLKQENEEIKNLSYLINLLTGIEHEKNKKIENPLIEYQSSWENLILNINNVVCIILLFFFKKKMF